MAKTITVSCKLGHSIEVHRYDDGADGTIYRRIRAKGRSCYVDCIRCPNLKIEFEPREE